MDADTPLHVSHDVSELLQNKLEALPHVERAFVHVDYDWHHIPVYDVPFFPVYQLLKYCSGTSTVQVSLFVTAVLHTSDIWTIYILSSNENL